VTSDVSAEHTNVTRNTSRPRGLASEPVVTEVLLQRCGEACGA
jgi:hypothetical protein